jgi:hypothetical protein
MQLWKRAYNSTLKGQNTFFIEVKTNTNFIETIFYNLVAIKIAYAF